MKKKILLVIFIIIIVAIIVLVKLNTKNKIPETQDSFTNQELNDMEYVDTKLKQLTSSDNYKELEINNRSIEVEKILKELKKDKYIKNYYYDENSFLFSFEYKCGALGGVMLKEFDSMFN